MRDAGAAVVHKQTGSSRVAAGRLVPGSCRTGRSSMPHRCFNCTQAQRSTRACHLAGPAAHKSSMPGGSTRRAAHLTRAACN